MDFIPPQSNCFLIKLGRAESIGLDTCHWGSIHADPLPDLFLEIYSSRTAKLTIYKSQQLHQRDTVDVLGATERAPRSHAQVAHNVRLTC